MTGINLVDVIAVLVVLVAIYLGWRSGFVVQALALAGFLGGLLVMVLLAPHFAGFLADFDTWLRTAIVISIVASIVLIAQGVGSAVGTAMRRRLGRGILGGVDQGAGAVFGFVRGVFIVWLVGGLLGVLPLPGLAAEARQSFILRAIDTRAPSPIVLAAELGRIVEAAGLPDVFVGAPPPIGVPEGGPTAEQAEHFAAAARASTVRVEATACGGFLTGSGFAVEADHFVTNAHVIAGSDRVWISRDGSFDRLEASVVHFDPRLDVAVLSVAGADFAPLALAGSSPERGDRGAALGFTGGGRQRVIPAVVGRVIEAIGRDIYGNQLVTRGVIEMRADVAPGDSGGPVLLADGTVGGVTFSESQSDTSIGYALAPVPVATAVDVALANGAPVGTGACLR